MKRSAERDESANEERRTTPWRETRPQKTLTTRRSAADASGPLQQRLITPSGSVVRVYVCLCESGGEGRRSTGSVRATSFKNHLRISLLRSDAKRPQYVHEERRTQRPKQSPSIRRVPSIDKCCRRESREAVMTAWKQFSDATHVQQRGRRDFPCWCAHLLR